MPDDIIRIGGAREHNLKNISLDIPRNKLMVITGLSGSGKSSLAFDTIYAEGQRRYIESLSAYARQFLSMLEKPDCDQITDLSPAIAIEQRAAMARDAEPRKTRLRAHDRHDLGRKRASLVAVNTQRGAASRLSSYPAKYVSLCVWAYPDLYYQMRRHVCLHLNNELYLDLNSWLYTELNR